MEKNIGKTWYLPRGLTLGLVVLVLFLTGRLVVTTVNAKDKVGNTGDVRLTTNRSDVTVCVETYDPAATRPDKEKVEKFKEIIDKKVKTNPKWIDQGFELFWNKVVQGCSTKPYLLQEGAEHLFSTKSSQATFLPYVDLPSPYRFHIYIVPEKVIREKFGEITDRNVTQEILWDEASGVGYEVTHALYLTEKEMEDLQFVESQLEKVLGLAQ